MDAPRLTELAAVVTTDLAAITRGRPIPADAVASAAPAGLGWTPANVCITPFNTIPDVNPWGSTGDVRLVPDLTARFRTGATGSPTPFDIVMGNIVELDGAPWDGCSRTRLIDAVADLEAETGLTLKAAFEQEFQLESDAPPARAFSYQALRRPGPFVPMVHAALVEAGVEPEMVLAEYGAHQFEITHAPAGAVVAADRAVAIREIVHEIAHTLGTRATFAPKTDPAGVGNGVHIHFSLIDRDGANATYDPARPAGLSERAGAFVAGVLRHLPAIVAFTAASVPSYLRLKPHMWSSSYTWLADRDREATVRICPTVTLGGRDPARQYNLEFRACDATANPYAALAAIVRAGLSGMQEGLETPPIVAGDPSAMSDEQRAALGLVRLPESLGDALDALLADEEARRWFPERYLQSYIAVKRTEIEATRDMPLDSLLAAYRAVY